MEKNILKEHELMSVLKDTSDLFYVQFASAVLVVLTLYK